MGPRGMRMGNGEGSTMYRSPNIVSVIKSRILKWARHAAKMEEGKLLSKF